MKAWIRWQLWTKIIDKYINKEMVKLNDILIRTMTLSNQLFLPSCDAVYRVMPNLCPVWSAPLLFAAKTELYL